MCGVQGLRTRACVVATASHQIDNAVIKTSDQNWVTELQLKKI
jgi:hypothetical protein